MVEEHLEPSVRKTLYSSCQLVWVNSGTCTGRFRWQRLTRASWVYFYRKEVPSGISFTRRLVSTMRAEFGNLKWPPSLTQVELWLEESGLWIECEWHLWRIIRCKCLSGSDEGGRCWIISQQTLKWALSCKWCQLRATDRILSSLQCLLSLSSLDTPSVLGFNSRFCGIMSNMWRRFILSRQHISARLQMFMSWRYIVPHSLHPYH